MKKFKKMMAIVLSLAVVLAFSVPTMVFAADDFKLTINNAVQGHTYTAYQIFKGTKADHSANKALGDVTWGSDITKAGKQALYAAYEMEVAEADLDKSENINALMEKVADKNNTTTTESDKAVKFGNVFFETATNGTVTAKAGLLTGPTGGKAIVAERDTVVFDGLASGYYLVNDSYSKEGETAGKDYSIARIAVQVVGDTTINNKADKPTLDKKIDGENDEDSTTTGEAQGDTVGIGGKVPYVLTSAVPNLDGYKNYFYVVNDTMTEGLTFNDDVVIKIGDTALTKTTNKTDTGKTFYVETKTDATTNATKIKIVLNNFIQYAEQAGDEIKITYSATVNEKAKVDETSNQNTATLTYSNNPLDDGRGTPETPNEPAPGDVTGETPQVKTDTFATVLKIKKVDGENKEETLTGAKFKITGTKHATALVNQEKYVKDAQGTYYMLKDGTYTETPPVTTEEGNTEEKYDSTTQMYKKVTTIDKTTVGADETFEVEGYVDSTGVLTITGLSEGEYTIQELVAPSGYNLLTAPVKIKLAYSYNAETGAITWTAPAKLSDETDNPVAYNTTNKAFEIDIENNQGAELPSTGGIGTTIFYVLGALLVVGAGVLLVTRRRMKTN